MRRLVAVAGLTVLVPVLAWRAASAVPDPPPDCTDPAVAAATDDCVAPAPAAPVDPVAVDDVPSSVPGSDVTTTTLDPGSTVPSTTVDPNAPTTTVDPNAPTTTLDPDAPTTTGAGTTTTTTDPDATTTTTIDPNATTTTTIDPNATTTTTIDPNATTTTTIDPNATTTTLDPLLVEDSDSDPVLPPVEAPGGRVVLPAGVVETGQTRSITFPVAGPVTYGNDWGACRDGCARAHKGIDIIGDRLQPILAMHDGVIDHLVDHPTAGNGVVIRDEAGWEYHVYHVNNDSPGTDDGADPAAWRYAPGIEAGVQVTAGQLIGWMGDSGNSEGSVPHAHVEIHVPGGQAINPYWSLRQAQRDVNCAVSTVETDPTIPTDGDWLRGGWTSAALPDGWQPLSLTGGRPGSGATNARMWIAAGGFTPVDSAALRAGDARYDAGVDCATTVEPQVVAPIPIELGAILSTIRAMESGGDYTVSVTTSTASGAYGFLDSSWGGYGGYRRARDAPPAVQDAKAAELAAYVLARNGGDVSTIPVSWYIGHVPVGAEWDTVPPYPGNRLTPREYQDRWMQRYAAFLGQPEAWVSGPSTTWTAADTSATCRTVIVDEGGPGAPQYVLTQAQRFVGETSGRAALDVADPCDPARAVAPAAPTVDVAAELVSGDDGPR